MAAAGTCFFFDWEVSLMVWLQTNFRPLITSFIQYLSIFGEELAMVVILGLLYWCVDKKLGKMVGFTALICAVWNPLLKNIFVRRRPYFDNPDIEILRVVEPDADIYDIAAQGFSFPSGHSSNAASVYAGLAINRRKKLFSVFAVVLPLVVGLSRVCVGAHYPTDVIVGWILGLAAALIIPFLYRKLNNEKLFCLIFMLIGLPGFFYCTSSDFYTGYGMMAGMFLGVLFEEKYVNFENTKSVVRSVLRIAGGAAVFFGLNTVLKLPFSSEFLDQPVFAARLVRTLRYTLVLFIDIGVYPILFRYTAKIGAKPAEKEE